MRHGVITVIKQVISAVYDSVIKLIIWCNIWDLECIRVGLGLAIAGISHNGPSPSNKHVMLIIPEHAAYTTHSKHNICFYCAADVQVADYA